MPNKCPKVAIYDPSTLGGIAQYTFELAEGLAKAGCRVTVITTEAYELNDIARHFDVWALFKPSRIKSWISRSTRVQARSSAHEVTIDAGFGSHGIYQRAIGWTISQLKSLRFAAVLCKAVLVLVLRGIRVVHFQWLIDRRADLLFMRTLRVLGIKIVYTVHDLLPHDEYTVQNRAFFQTLYGYPDKLIVHTENNRKEILDLFSIDPEKLCVIPLGCPSVLLDRFPSSPRVARRYLNIPESSRVILFFGLIRPYKGLEYLLQAFEIIKSRSDNVMLLIAGKIYQHDPNVYRHYSSLLARYEARDDVRFKDGYVPLQDIAHYFSAADVVILPYIKASQSAVLLSAYAAGKAVIVTQTGGLGDVVRNGHSGFVVPPRDANAIADAAVAILNNPEMRQQICHEAKLLADTTYSWRNISLTTLRLYQSLVFVRGAAGGLRPTFD